MIFFFHGLFTIRIKMYSNENIQRCTEALWIRTLQFYLLPSRKSPIGITINSIFFPLGKWNSLCFIL